MQRRQNEYARLLADTKIDRIRFAIGFIVGELRGVERDEEVPIRGWPADDLVTIFEAEVSKRPGAANGRPVDVWLGSGPRPPYCHQPFSPVTNLSSRGPQDESPRA